MNDAYCHKLLDGDLDDLLSMKWLPWIGDRYWSSPNRILILGESHYDWWNEGSNETHDGILAFLNEKNFTRKCVNGDSKMMDNIPRLLLADNAPSEPDRENLWRRLSYHNLVLRHMNSIEERPSTDDYELGWEAFFDVVEILRPTHCLAAGTEWKKFAALKKAAAKRGIELRDECRSEKISGAEGKKVDVLAGKMALATVFVMHPSSRNFSWGKWRGFMEQFIPISSLTEPN